MLQCLALAKKGIGKVSPNPLVGSIVVYKNKIIGKGYHEKYGLHHAEVNAINSVKNKALLSQSILYVNLEPCSHHGNTPPCCEFIVKNKIKTVVIGCLDSSAKVNGKGIEYLKNNGVEVITDVLKSKCNWANRRFFTNHINKRPYIILKWAQTKDGFIDKIRTPESTGINWITSQETKRTVHKWRNEEDAILVGRRTVEVDNPELTVRKVKGKNPLRIVIDPELKLNRTKKIFNFKAKTIVLNYKIDKIEKNIRYLKTTNNSAITDLFTQLQKEKISSLIIEGGAKTINYFIKNNLWDEARVLIGNTEFKKGLKAPEIKKNSSNTSSISKDKLVTYYND